MNGEDTESRACYLEAVALHYRDSFLLFFLPPIELAVPPNGQKEPCQRRTRAEARRDRIACDTPIPRGRYRAIYTVVGTRTPTETGRRTRNRREGGSRLFARIGRLCPSQEARESDKNTSRAKQWTKKQRNPGPPPFSCPFLQRPDGGFSPVPTPLAPITSHITLAPFETWGPCPQMTCEPPAHTA